MRDVEIVVDQVPYDSIELSDTTQEAACRECLLAHMCREHGTQNGLCQVAREFDGEVINFI